MEGLQIVIDGKTYTVKGGELQLNEPNSKGGTPCAAI